MRHDVWFLVALLQVLGFIGAQSQRTHARQGIGNARESPQVRIPGQGTLAGKEVFLARTQRVIQYLGIPYAKPPLGPLRFAAPVTNPLPSWPGVRNASQFAPSCQQDHSRLKLHEKLYMRMLPPDQPDPGVSEDCLFLNIYIPDGNRPPEGWPVMVWFHGGDFNTGTPAIWDASVFVAKQKVLMVTVAYRLNILGFFTTTDAEASGNYGMLDQIAALDWIKKNIEVFGGSPSNVVIFGHSSGAISVGLHMMSPLSKGKFDKAIAMSGDAISSVRTPDLEVPVVDMIAEKFGCYRNPTSALMECLRRVNATILVKLSSDIETWGPIVDVDTTNSSDPFLPAHPKEILAGGNYFAVPLITGFTNNEQALAYIEAIGSENVDGRLSLEKFEMLISDETTATVMMKDQNTTCELRPHLVSEAVLFFYRPHPPSRDQTLLRDKYLHLQTEKNYASGLTELATRVAKFDQAYVYRFDYRARTPAATKDVPEWAGVPHMFELPFVWGVPYAANSKINWNNADKKMSDVMMSMFATFAKSGNPSLPTIKWEPFVEKHPGLLIIERTFEMSEGNAIDYKALAFWNEYYPMILEEALNTCCNATGGATSVLDFTTSRTLSLMSMPILWYLGI